MAIFINMFRLSEINCRRVVIVGAPIVCRCIKTATVDFLMEIDGGEHGEAYQLGPQSTSRRVHLRSLQVGGGRTVVAVPR